MAQKVKDNDLRIRIASALCQRFADFGQPIPRREVLLQFENPDVLSEMEIRGLARVNPNTRDYLPSAGSFALLGDEDELCRRACSAFTKTVNVLWSLYRREGGDTQYQRSELLETAAEFISEGTTQQVLDLGLYLCEEFGIFSTWGYNENRTKIEMFRLGEVLITMRDPTPRWRERILAARAQLRVPPLVPEHGEVMQREYLDKLDRIEFELGEQDTLILEQMNRSKDATVSQSQRALLWRLFEEVQGLDLGYFLPAVDSDNPDSVRPEIRSARAKVVWERNRIRRAYGLVDEPLAETGGDSSLSPFTRPQPVIFIGHGRAKDWLELKQFLTERLNTSCVEFNSESAAGLSTQQRLEEMLAQATFAFLLLTAEDEHADGRRHARENVIHEAGLFQGKLGFRKAILLVEDDCERPSNVHGLTYIGFPKSRINASFEEVRRVLEREQVI